MAVTVMTMVGGGDDGGGNGAVEDDRVMMGMTMVCTATSIQKHTLILRKDLGSRTSAHALLVGATILIPTSSPSPSPSPFSSPPSPSPSMLIVEEQKLSLIHISEPTRPN